MSRCWVEFRERQVPNTWNPDLVGKRFRPKRKPRYFGSVPTIRCLGTKRGLKCLRRNTINKRWYSLSPARTCGRMFFKKRPRSAKESLEVRGQRAQFSLQKSRNADDRACREECIGPMVQGMKIPSEYEAHILDHMRCNCSACMNFACHWRRALKDEFRQRVKDPLAPRRKPKRWMPVLERHRSPERALCVERPDKRSHCRRSPRVSWWYGNYSPSSDSDENFLNPEAFDVEQTQNDKWKHLGNSKHAVQSTADGFDHVAMDGTTLPSRLTYRTHNLPGMASACRDSATRCASSVATSFKRPQSTRRNRLVQGILNEEDAPFGSEIDELGTQNSHRLTTRHTPTKYASLPCDNWGKDDVYENNDASQNLYDSNEYLKLSEPEKCRSFKSRNLLFSDKTANKYFPYRSTLRSSRSGYQSVIHDDKVNHYGATPGSRYRPTFSERADNYDGSGYHHSNHSKESYEQFSYPDIHVPTYTQNNLGDKREHYQPYNKIHSGKYFLDSNPTLDANTASHGSLSGSFSHPDEGLDSCNNRRFRHCDRRHRSHTDQRCSHRHQHNPPRLHYSPSHVHDDRVWNYPHHTSWRTTDTEYTAGMPRQLPKHNRDYPNYTEFNQGMHFNKNICNRSGDGGTLDPRSSPAENIRKKTNFHLGKSEKSQKPDSENSGESKTSGKSRSLKKMCKQWTALSPSRFDLYPSNSQSVSAMDFNDNDNRTITESPDSVYSKRELSRTTEKREDGKHCSQTSSVSRRKQQILNTDMSPLSAGSSREGDTTIYKRQRKFSLSPLDSVRLKTQGSSRRSRSRSRRKDNSKTKLLKDTRQLLDTTQSNSVRSPSSPIKHRLDTKTPTFGPSERVMREGRPKSRPEWLNKHLSLMTECSQEQQKNAKSRMTRIVDKTNALSRSTEHMKMDLSHIHERLDRVKDLQESYFERAEEAIQRLKDRSSACFDSELAKDNSQNARENHHRLSDSGFREGTADRTAHRRGPENANRRETRTRQSSSSVERGRLRGGKKDGNEERRRMYTRREDGNEERRRMYTRREDGNVERHNRGRIAHSDADSGLGLGGTFPADDVTDSGSQSDNQTDDGKGSWFIDNKRRLVARKNTMKHRYQMKW